ncbi:MAG: AbrB/MazE/SpoVT family DNA-binding domain-containing protein [Candidatus Rokubacteria bacterium]|nr:AbrB/MazE/SpoVT family DNA-binding domain-containing protein [Candidatus Rokubacteria bacterium]
MPYCPYGGFTMVKKLTKTGNSLALVLDKPILDRLEIDAETRLEVSTDGDVIVISPVRDRRRTARLKRIVEEAHRQYGGVFRRLAEE